MIEKERAGGLAVATIPLDVRFARAVGSNSCVERIFWSTLLPDLPQEARQRYLLEGPDLLRTDLGNVRHTATGLESLDLRYRSFAKAVLNGGAVPELPYLPAAKDRRLLRINYPVLLADIANSAGMTPAVVSVNMHCWRIGQVEVAPEIAGLPIGFVGKPGKCMKEITELAAGRYPGGILVPCKGELSEQDLRFLRERGVAVFGLVEDCKLEGGMISVRAPRDWYLVLVKQVNPEELRAARRPIGIVTWRPPPNDTAKVETENGVAACGRKDETAGGPEATGGACGAQEKGEAAVLQRAGGTDDSSQGMGAANVGKTEQNIWTFGDLIIAKEDDETYVTIGNGKSVALKGQCRQIVNAMLGLKATSVDKARYTKDILGTARILSDIRLRTPFLAPGASKTVRKKLWNNYCHQVGEGKKGKPYQYYLGLVPSTNADATATEGA